MEAVLLHQDPEVVPKVVQTPRSHVACVHAGSAQTVQERHPDSIPQYVFVVHSGCWSRARVDCSALCGPARGWLVRKRFWVYVELRWEAEKRRLRAEARHILNVCNEARRTISDYFQSSRGKKQVCFVAAAAYFWHWGP